MRQKQGGWARPTGNPQQLHRPIRLHTPYVFLRTQIQSSCFTPSLLFDLKKPVKLVQQEKKAEKSARDNHDQKTVDEMRTLTAGSSSAATSSATIAIDDDDDELSELSEAEPEWIENLVLSENDDDEVEIEDDED